MYFSPAIGLLNLLASGVILFLSNLSGIIQFCNFEHLILMLKVKCGENQVHNVSQQLPKLIQNFPFSFPKRMMQV